MKSPSKKLTVGKKVTWNTSRGRTVGVVVKKLTDKTRIKTHKVSASEKSPEYLVKSLKTGKLAAHKAKALMKSR
jgi:hypothetical protein